jgi:hypothetical protein
MNKYPHQNCTAPPLAAFIRQWHDDLGAWDQEHLDLQHYASRIVGTLAHRSVDERAAWMALDWMTREHTPAWLRLAGFDRYAEQLEALPTLMPPYSHSAFEAEKLAEKLSYYVGDATGDRAWTKVGRTRMVDEGFVEAAERDADWAAALEASQAANRTAGWVAAWEAAQAAGYNAERIAVKVRLWVSAHGSAWMVAKNLGREALIPTICSLQESALELYDRMIELYPQQTCSCSPQKASALARPA